MSLPCGLVAKTKNIRELSENQSKPILKTAAFNVSEKSLGYFDWNICCRTYFKLIGPVFMGVFPELAFVKHLCTTVYEFWKITSMPKIGFDLRLYKNSNEVYYVTLGFPADSPSLFSWATEVQETRNKNNIF